ncbi:MAG: sugar transferase [Ancrocorticia sp.]
MRRFYFAVSKRFVDIVASVLGLFVLAPLIAGIAVTVRIKLGSPVLFRQVRPGKDNELFTLYKFRSMKDVDEENGLITNEQRMTVFGCKLRASSLDELPTLWNVLRGDMSLVGPRPLLVEYLPLYSSTQARRHEVRPGVTGLAQAKGRNALSWDQKFLYDVHYVDNCSFIMDMRILAMTVRQVLKRDGIASDGYLVGEPFSPNNEKSR